MTKLLKQKFNNQRDMAQVFNHYLQTLHVAKRGKEISGIRKPLPLIRGGAGIYPNRTKEVDAAPSCLLSAAATQLSQLH